VAPARAGFAPRAQRGMRVAGAFVWMGYTEARAYPLAFFFPLVTALTSPVVYYFVAQLVDSGPSVGDSYYTFAVIGLAANAAMAGGLTAFASTLDYAIQQGRLETLLVEPVRWRLLPFGLAGWAVVVHSLSALFQFSVGILLGAEINVTGVPVAVIVVVLGILAGHAVGIISGSVKVLSKRSDPVLGLYMTLAFLLSGVVFPVGLLPLPLRVLSYFIPHTYVLSALRHSLMTDTSGITGPAPGPAIALLIVFVAVVYPFGLWLWGRALDYGRTLGVLAGY
jgi:ABC-2 type transport system permease protein